jgi:DNA polymerase lambda
VSTEVESIFGQEKVKVETCGSYRRGKQTCGDVDILVTRTDDKPVTGMLNLILERLEAKDFLKERLSHPRQSDKGSQSYMGVCKLPEDPHYRRIDIKCYPKAQWGFALLYFTGSDYFNRSMRLYAERQGYSLSDHGLTPVTKVNKQKVAKGLRVTGCATEREVFEKLGLPYKEPHERDI